MLEYADKLLQSKLAPDLTRDAAKILEELYTPQTCWEKYVHTEKASEQTLIQEDDLDELDTINVNLGNMAEAKDKFPKHVGQLFELLLEVVSFKYFSDCQDLCANGAPNLLKALQDLGQAESGTKTAEL